MSQSVPKKVVILGISGAGKSWFARRLSSRLSIPVVHYDTLCWDADWTEVHELEVRKRLLEAIEEDNWILEGYVSPAAHERLAAADIVLYLDYSGWRAAWGGLRRWWRYRTSPRPELPEGCEDSWSWERLRIMWTRDERKEIEREVHNFKHKVIRFYSPDEAEHYLQNL